MESDPTLHTKSMAVQLQILIVDAFQCLSSLLLVVQRPYLVIIDGLDECHDKANPTGDSPTPLQIKAITVHKLPLPTGFYIPQLGIFLLHIFLAVSIGLQK